MTDAPERIPTEPIHRQDSRTLVDQGRREVEKLTTRLAVLKIETVPIDSIYPNPYNPNRQSEHEFELLKLSILEDGFTQPIIVQRSSRMIVDGEHRWKALTQLGSTIIPVVFVDMQDAQMRISTLRHNRARGSEDVELSVKILEDLRELGGLERAVSSLDIDDTEIAALLSDLNDPQQMASEFYSTSWVPDKTADARLEAERREGSDRTVATSANAIKALEETRKQFENATSNLELGVASVTAHNQVRQISASFTDGDAQIIRQALGNHPAQSLIEICVAYVLSHSKDYDEPIVQSAKAIQQKWSA